MIPMKKLKTLMLALPLLLCGCATNAYTQFYKDYTSGASPDALNNLMPYSGHTDIITIDTPEEFKDAAEKLESKGYTAIGEANFTAGGAWYNTISREEYLRQHAQKVGADYVMYVKREGETTVSEIPVTNYNPGPSFFTTSSNGTFYSTTSTGSYSTQYIPSSQTDYIYNTVFWRKIKQPILGVRTVDLPKELRAELKQNTGALVKTVIDDSPAFVSNIVPGDIMIKVGGTDIISAKEVPPVVHKYAGLKCDIVVLRDGKQVSIPVQLNSLDASPANN
jgi:serine protease Do